MYYSEEITPELIQKLTSEEDSGELYKIGAGNRIVRARNCEHCNSEFYPSRKNQKYCSSSCRVMACYKRKDYAYKDGKYVKSKGEESKVPAKQNQHSEKRQFDWNNFGENALATASVETAKYWLHDRPLMEKVDKVIDLLSSNNLGSKIHYKGVQLIDGKPIALFVDENGHTVVNDHNGYWFKLVSNNPVSWEQIRSPLQT